MSGNPSNTFTPLAPESLVDEATKVSNFIASYYTRISDYPVRSSVEPGYLRKLIPDTCPSSPQSLELILDEINHKILPGLTHWQSPNFFAYYPANASNAGLMGEMLCAGLNVVGFNWISSPSATELEQIVMDWIGKMLDLPKEFLFSGTGGGVIHGTTCEAMLCTLAAARDRALSALGAEMITKLVVYCSDQTHFSLQKAAKLVGIPPQNYRKVPTSSSAEFALRPDDVGAMMKADLGRGMVPLYLCASVGATPTGAVDPIKGLGSVAKQYGAWLHVDAAYAGSACICPEYRHFLDGVELADSIGMNAHKWFLTNMDSCCVWLQNPRLLVDSLSTKPEILRNAQSESERVVDYKDWQMALSRRFRSLKLWMVMSRCGVANLMRHIRSDVDLTNHLAALIEKDKRFELLLPQRFSLLCFRLRPGSDQAINDNGWVMNEQLLNAINASGLAFLTHAVVEGKFVIRCAIGATLTEYRHIDGLWNLIQEKADGILMK